MIPERSHVWFILTYVNIDIDGDFSVATMGLSQLKFSGEIAVDEASVSRWQGAAYPQRVKAAAVAYQEAIQNELPPDMLLGFQSVKEITPMGQSLAADEVIIRGNGLENGIKVRRHVPESLQDFWGIVLAVAKAVASGDPHLAELQQQLVTETQSLKQAQESLQQKGFPAKVWLYPVLEAVTRLSREFSFRLGAEARVERTLFADHADHWETIQMRQVAEPLETFLERVEAEAKPMDAVFFGQSSSPKAGVPKIIDVADFEREVLQAKGPVLVKFSAPWCHWCDAIQPDIEAFAVRHQGKIKVVEVELMGKRAPRPIDEAVRAYGVWERGLPTLSLFEGGQERAQLVCDREVISNLAGHIERKLLGILQQDRSV